MTPKPSPTDGDKKVAESWLDANIPGHAAACTYGYVESLAQLLADERERLAEILDERARANRYLAHELKFAGNDKKAAERVGIQTGYECAAQLIRKGT